MDRNSNPGKVERQMDESPMEGRSGSDTEIDRGMRGGELERDGMGGHDDRMSGSDRLGVENPSSDDGEMRASGREGGYGYDRPADLTVSRDDMRSSSRDTDQGTSRERDW